MQQIHVGFFSAKDYLDKTELSGVIYNTHQALKSRDMEIIGVRNPINHSGYFKKIKRNIDKFIPVKSTSIRDSKARFAGNFQKRIKAGPCDLLFCPFSSTELSFLATSLPIVYLSDATVKQINETYKIYSTPEEFILASQEETAAISRANKLVYSSEWAANSAVSDYGANPNKIEIVPFGANVEKEKVPEVNQILNKCLNSRCRLLFIGTNWTRKGGNIAFETLVSLINQGIDAELLMIGCIVPPEFKHERVKVMPFLNKNIPQQQEQYFKLLLESHFLISPTRADCSPMVFAEANAYGIPVITTDVGGIPTIIRNGRNGYMFPLSASSDEYANLIATNFSDKDTYEQLVRFSREEYETRLNWDTWGQRIYDIMKDTINYSGSHLSAVQF
ncbi:glycosyltransferase family 4 protein [Limnofasciculus baicalensis]|uniref:Glycosyltransferase family 4 protein n=1 Tax=Limnofasciculus baicalensis BBK-W-15 TaxID=2699891 RepID=A0AAE3KQJ1_9CYAN|nr:glycosyltransferase family 4 protein [Limnofasciculus baicalensis]MCP2727427.1 glycosyltransferase family 4 protein [Limnofasciculus baicalensis BBK-W-15]